MTCSYCSGLETAITEATAHRDAALTALADLVRYVHAVGGFMEHVDQMQLRHAEALLADSGRSVER